MQQVNGPLITFGFASRLQNQRCRKALDGQRAFHEPCEFRVRASFESGVGPPHSTTLARWPRSPELPPGFGVRRPCGALEFPGRFKVPMHAEKTRKGAFHEPYVFRVRLPSKAVEGRRTPRRWRAGQGHPNFRQVLECAGPAALWNFPGDSGSQCVRESESGLSMNRVNSACALLSKAAEGRRTPRRWCVG